MAPQFWKTGLPPHSQQTTRPVFLSDFIKLYTVIIQWLVDDYYNKGDLLRQQIMVKNECY